ncbi:MAG: carboxypeptidase regulatory-like domain-containing protein [Acidobacteriia bacterium]|nr:carboxypeptidase regulatory-like domain-containing protein [Terriglobia bacterium]
MLSGRKSFVAIAPWLLGALLVGLYCGFAVRPMTAQVLYGSVVGTITDQSDSVVPGATVTLTSKETGVSREVQTDSAGRYSFVNVLPGRYDVKVVATGFRTSAQTDLEVTPNTVGRVDMKLEVGQLTETVSVEATAALLQTDKSDTHSEINTKEVVGLPASGYRNYQSLINLVPGATPAAFQNSITDTPGRALQTHINGGNAQTNITRIDGATSVNIWLPHHVGYVVPAETVDTVNITTSAADAEQGMAGTSAITLITKSGSNEIHGSAYEFHDDQHLKARNFFQAAGTDKPLSIYNNFGATVGGPIRKNRLFYFLSYDGTRQRQGSPGFYSVPTADQRVGDFSAYPTVIYDPNTGNADGTGRQPFAGNKIPTTRLDPIALKLQSYYPAPNVAGATLNNYFASGGPILSRNYFDTKINFTVNDKESVWGHYGRMWATSGGQAVFGLAGGPGLPGADPGLGDTLIQVGTIGHTHIFSPHLILDGVLGYERQGQNVTPNDFGTNYGLQFGIPNTNGPDPLQSGFPNINQSNYTGFGVPNWMPLLRVEESYTHSDNVTYTHGAHELRFGFDLVRHHLNHWQPEIGGGPRGALTFNGGPTALNGGPAPNQYNGYAAFLLGLDTNADKSLQYILSTGREWQFGWYARDRWQVSRNLTINIGLRYEFYPLMTRAGKGLERYDPNTNQVLLGGRGGQPDNVGITVSHKLFAPRVGLAYRLGDKTVIRTGYGINYDPIPFSRPLRGWYPLVVDAAFVQPNSFAPAGSLETGVPNTVGPDVSSGSVTLPGNVDERSPWGGLIHRGYEQSWNFTIERKLPEDLVMSVGYVGTKSTHLLADYDINAGYPGSTTANLPYNLKYGRTVQTRMWDGYLSSNYHALQVALNRSFANGLLVKAAYTYSHTIDYTDDDGWANVSWNWAPVFQRNRATAGFDRTHVLQIGWVYELPVGKGKMLAKSGVAAAVLGGWQVNGVMSAYTGTPFTVGDSTALNAPSLSNTQTANQVKSVVQRPGNVGPGTVYYDPTAFASVGIINTFGSSGRNILRNPGAWNTDLNITREFPIKERLRMQFRGEFYNLPNTSHFNGPASTSVTGGTNFMSIRSSYGERQIRFATRFQW